jgi:hypothetical protein
MIDYAHHRKVANLSLLSILAIPLGQSGIVPQVIKK